MAKIGGTLDGKTCTPPAGGTGYRWRRILTARSAIWSSVIVGAYFSGGQYARGIAHPAGQCSMKNSCYTPFGVPEGVSALCQVCRYALVDHIDPEKHWQNDLDYDMRLPL